MEVQETTEGLIIPVRVRPGSGRFAMKDGEAGLVVELSGPAREGRANQELVKELSRILRCEVRIVSGLRSRRKIILLKGITEKELRLFLETH